MALNADYDEIAAMREHDLLRLDNAMRALKNARGDVLSLYHESPLIREAGSLIDDACGVLYHLLQEVSEEITK